MQNLLRYLAIPADYAEIQELRWARNGEAIEKADGKTFIISKMLPPFLEGFASQRPLIHFVYVLELLQLLGQGDESPPGIPLRLCRAVREAFAPRGTLRNAGAFFGTVCDAVPAAYLSRAEGLNLARWLATQPVYPYVEMTHNPEAPPLELPAFRRLISERLQDFSEIDLRKWFRFGTG